MEINNLQENVIHSKINCINLPFQTQGKFGDLGSEEKEKRTEVKIIAKSILHPLLAPSVK